MRTKIFTICFLFILFSDDVISQSFKSISKEICKCEFRTGLKKAKKDTFYTIREKLYSLEKLDFIAKSDTLFLIESYSFENGDYYGLIWNTLDKLGYVYNNGIFRFDVDKVYTDYTSKLVQDWDTTSIRKEEELNSSMMNPRNIYAKRVVKRNGNVEVECIKFKEFFLLNRDR